VTWFRRFLNYIITWRKHREVIKELNTLTDKQLDDIGISRYNIDRLVWLEEDKKKRGSNE
jgi:uncharacterized protein YjiS (DUF1127 family)